jgi:uncharacterized protein (DUF342 family)
MTKAGKICTAAVSAGWIIKNRSVSVASSYIISGDADLSVGNISFDGMMLIKGNVTRN